MFRFLTPINLQYSTVFIPDEDGDWELSMNVAGRANLFLDKKLIIDLSTDPEQGDSFFALGTVDVKATIPSLKAGQSYYLEIRLESAEFIERGAPFRCWGGIRLGGVRKIDPQVELKHAVELAKEADGKVSYLDSYPYLNTSQVTILAVGLNHEFVSICLNKEVILTNFPVSKVKGSTDLTWSR